MNINGKIINIGDIVTYVDDISLKIKEGMVISIVEIKEDIIQAKVNKIICYVAYDRISCPEFIDFDKLTVINKYLEIKKFSGGFHIHKRYTEEELKNIDTEAIKQFYPINFNHDDK